MTNGLRAGVIVYRRNHAANQAGDFMGDGLPARHVGTVVFDLLNPPFKHKTVDRETLSKERGHACYLTPSRETLCYLVAPNLDAIEGALGEHQHDQDLTSPAWANIIRAIRYVLA